MENPGKFAWIADNFLTCLQLDSLKDVRSSWLYLATAVGSYDLDHTNQSVEFPNHPMIVVEFLEHADYLADYVNKPFY